MPVLTIKTRFAPVVLFGLMIALGAMSARLAQAEDTNESAAANSISVDTDLLPGRYFKWSVFAIDDSGSTRFKEINCQAPGPPALLYGCGKGHDGNQLSSAGRFGTFGALEFSVGYRPSSRTRREISALFHPSFRFRGNANYTTQTNFTTNQPVEAKTSSLAIMLSQYLEFPIDPSGPVTSSIGEMRPFIGFGVGLSRIKLQRTTMNLPNNYTFVPGAARYNLAWMLMAGISSQISERVTLDLTVRYTKLGEVRSGKGDILIDFKNPSLSDVSVAVHPTRATLSTTGIQMSLRHEF